MSATPSPSPLGATASTFAGNAGEALGVEATPVTAGKKRPGSQRQPCACGKRDGGICRSRNVKGAAGLRLPYPTPSELNTWVGSPKYKQREVQLKALMGEQKFAANKEQLMKPNANLRVHRDHYPARNGKPHLTPSKRQPGALVLRSASEAMNSALCL